MLAFALVLGIGVGQLTLWKSLDRLLDRIGLGYVDRMPSAWDYVVREPRGSWVKIQLKDGLGIIGGIYGSNSVASLDPRRADVYLEETWQLDEAGNFVGPVIDSQGVWVAHDVGPRAMSPKVKGVVQPQSWFIDIATMSME
jgi:hypothetical protein